MPESMVSDCASYKRTASAFPTADSEDFSSEDEAQRHRQRAQGTRKQHQSRRGGAGAARQQKVPAAAAGTDDEWSNWASEALEQQLLDEVNTTGECRWGVGGRGWRGAARALGRGGAGGGERERLGHSSRCHRVALLPRRSPHAAALPLPCRV